MGLREVTKRPFCCVLAAMLTLSKDLVSVGRRGEMNVMLHFAPSEMHLEITSTDHPVRPTLHQGQL